MRLTKLLLLTACATLPTSGALAEGTAKSSMKHQMKETAASVKFEPNSAVLSEDSKSKLRKLIRDARAKKEIRQVTVAAWSDKSLPQKGENLMDADRILADNRAKAISEFLRTGFEITDVEAYNMAEPANWLARTFNTTEAELKSIFGRTDAETPVTRAEIDLIRKLGAASLAVVVAEHEMSGSSVVPAPSKNSIP